MSSLHITCKTNAKSKRFAGNPGKFFRVRCPNCANEKAAIFGTTIYHPLSSICKAATHSGSLRKNRPGEIIIQLLGGKPVYNGSPGMDGNISATFGASDRSFLVKKAPKLTKIHCDTSAKESIFEGASVGKKFAVLCPRDCSKKAVIIYGEGTYTDDSAICISGIHYGVLSDLGGEIAILIEGGKPSYKGSKGFGIVSLERGSHVRSFKFLGHKNAIHHKWEEDYNPQFTKKNGK